MGFLAPKPPQLPPVPPIPTAATSPTPSAEEAAAIEAKSAEDYAAEQRRISGYFGRGSTIVAGRYDLNQQQLGAKTILGG